MTAEYSSIKADFLSALTANFTEIQELFGIETIGIFGSVARGEDTPYSDVDVLYKFSTETIRLHQFIGLKNYLQALFGRNVDLVGINWMEPSIRPYIEEDMILFHAGVAEA